MREILGNKLEPEKSETEESKVYYWVDDDGNVQSGQLACEMQFGKAILRDGRVFHELAAHRLTQSRMTACVKAVEILSARQRELTMRIAHLLLGMEADVNPKK